MSFDSFEPFGRRTSGTKGTLVEVLGGGLRDGARLRTLQVGGPLGTTIPGDRPATTIPGIAGQSGCSSCSSHRSRGVGRDRLGHGGEPREQAVQVELVK